MKAHFTVIFGLTSALALSACGSLPHFTQVAPPAPTVESSPGNGVLPDQPTSIPGPDLRNTNDFVFGLAVVDSIDIMALESFPVQVQAVLKGSLPDGSTRIGTIDQSYDPRTQTFTLTVRTIRPKNQMCTLALVAYQQNVPLKVYGLPKGTYTVSANGKAGTFELQADNVLTAP